MQTFDVTFDISMNKFLDKKSRGWWYETPRGPGNVGVMLYISVAADYKWYVNSME